MRQRSLSAVLRTIILTLTAAALPCSALAGQDPAAAPPQAASDQQNPRRLTIDELQNIDVTSVAKHAEPVGETAAAVSIIRQDDIRRAGITTLPEALRLAAGVEVARSDGRTWAISARGFDISTANKMLVLIDGRSVYTPLFSGVFWDAQDLVLDDIDRIEVIRGPGGALWGANAMNGVINIITKRASDTQGTLVTLDGGDSLGQAVLQYGSTVGASGSYRVYGKFRYLGAQVFADGSSAKDPLQSGQTGARFDFDFGHTAVTVQGDAYDGSEGSFDRSDSQISGQNVLARVTRTGSSGQQLQLQMYYDGTYRMVPQQFKERRDTVDLDLQYRFSPLGRHDITTGGGVDVSRSATTASIVLSFDPATRVEPLFNVFGQDIITLAPRHLFLTLGAKAEHNVYTGAEYEPTVRLRWTPANGRTLWGEVSRAVRMPTRFDTDLRFTGFSPIVVLRGDPGFQSETMVAHEVGYRQSVSHDLAVSVTAYENDYDHLRSQEPTLPSIVPIVLSNLLTARTEGLEFTADWQPSSWWEVNSSYSYLHERLTLKPNSLDTTGGASEANDRTHMFSMRSFFTLPRHTEFDATFRAIGSLPHPKIPAYSELTLHFGIHPMRALELALVGDNLLHPQHQEFSTLANPEEFTRSWFVQATWRF